MTGIVRRARNHLIRAVRGVHFLKGKCELEYWRGRVRQEVTLHNDHYAWFYTTHFGFEDEFYRNKRVLDIGCGPRGSLEWADMAEERVGLDPLADSYRELGAKHHKMSYVQAPAERIPFADGHFDVVCSFNSLDHVDNLDESISEILRVLAPGGHFLLLTDVNHEPTPTEPVELGWDIVDRFAPPLEVLETGRFEKLESGIYDSVRAAPYDEDDASARAATLSAKFRKPG